MNSWSFAALEIQQFPGKGGWHYVTVPIPITETSGPFGWLEVQCTIDDLELGKIKLMPSGKKSLFLPLKKSLRTKLKKELGATVNITVQLPYTTQDENFLEQSLQFSSALAHDRYLSLDKPEQIRLKKWIQSTTLESKQIEKIERLIQYLEKNLKLNDLK